MDLKSSLKRTSYELFYVVDFCLNVKLDRLIGIKEVLSLLSKRQKVV